MIGYSFGDQELKKIVEDSLEKNQNLHIELISPWASELAKIFAKNERIHWFESGVEEWIQHCWGIKTKKSR